MDGGETPLAIRICLPASLARYWPDIKPWVQECVAFTAGCYQEIDLYRSVLHGEHGLWLIIEGERPIAFVMTKIEKHPRRWLLSVPFVGGIRMQEWWKPMLEQLIGFAKHCGCDGISGFGREGWQRLIGMKKKAVWLVKDI